MSSASPIRVPSQEEGHTMEFVTATYASPHDGVLGCGEVCGEGAESTPMDEAERAVFAVVGAQNRCDQMRSEVPTAEE